MINTNLQEWHTIDSVDSKNYGETHILWFA